MEEVLTTAVDTVIIVDVREVFASLVPDIITFEVFVPWPSSLSFATFVAVFCTVDSSVDACVITPVRGKVVVIVVTVEENRRG